MLSHITLRDAAITPLKSESGLWILPLWWRYTCVFSGFFQISIIYLHGKEFRGGSRTTYDNQAPHHPGITSNVIFLFNTFHQKITFFPFYIVNKKQSFLLLEREEECRQCQVVLRLGISESSDMIIPASYTRTTSRELSFLQKSLVFRLNTTYYFPSRPTPPLNKWQYK